MTVGSWSCVTTPPLDETPAILKAYAREHPERTVVLRNERNHKLAYSLNRCLEHASGDLVARMDAMTEADPNGSSAWWSTCVLTPTSTWWAARCSVSALTAGT